MSLSRASGTLSHIGRHLALAGVVTMLVGACAAASGALAPPAATAVIGAAPAPAVAAPVSVSGGETSSGSAVGSASTGVAIAYPYPRTLAPDHTIVVTGFGQASMAADQSDRATAQETALKAALADAKAQADVVASTTGVTIQGVLSVSVSSSPGYFGPMPYAVTSPPSTGSGAPVPIQPPVAPTPELDVTVTVAYRIG